MSAFRFPVLVSLLGESGAGKTTLATRLVERWSARGLRTGYMKHASHGFALDRPGKDSFRVAAAGADGVVLAGPQGVAFQETELDVDPLRLVARFLADRDLVVVEGFRAAALPTVVVVGAGGLAWALREVRGDVLAFVRGPGAPAVPPAPPVPPERASAPVFAAHEDEALVRLLDVRLGLLAEPASAPA